MNATVPTLLANHTLALQIVKYNVSIPLPGPRRPHRVVTKVWANGVQVGVPDVVAMNGAVHIMGRLIDPRGKKGKHEHGEGMASDPDDAIEWEDWEDWLPAWAAGA